MKSLRNTSLIALAILCVALWGCASSKDDDMADTSSTEVIESTDAAVNTAETNPNSGYVSGSTIADPSGGATAQVTTVTPVPVDSTSSTTITETTTEPVDTTASTSLTTTTSVTTTKDDMTSSSSLNDQEDTTGTSRTRLRKD